ncbi:MAG: hypothetical protein AAFV59_10255 [Pseudomonadota bacterium]
MAQKVSFGRRHGPTGLEYTCKYGVKKPELRTADRQNVWCESYVYSYDDETTLRTVRKAIILDANAFGVRVRSHSRARYSETAVIKAGRLGLHKRATLVWQKGFDAGFRFD